MESFWPLGKQKIKILKSKSNIYNLTPTDWLIATLGKKTLSVRFKGIPEGVNFLCILLNKNIALHCSSHLFTSIVLTLDLFLLSKENSQSNNTLSLGNHSLTIFSLLQNLKLAIYKSCFPYFRTYLITP
jgi:hypothetical protein